MKIEETLNNCKKIVPSRTKYFTLATWAEGEEIQFWTSKYIPIEESLDNYIEITLADKEAYEASKNESVNL